MPPQSRPLRSLLVLAASLALGVLLAELIIRLTPLGRPTFDLTPFLQYHRTLGWTTRPLARGYVYDREFVTRLEYNPHGMRGPDRRYEKARGTYRILLLGDSFVDGYTVAVEKRASEQLEALLNSARPAGRIEVLAMGVPGYSTDQELLALESEGLKYGPDLVVLMFFDNDIYGNGLPFFFGPKPQFLWDGQRLRLHNVPVPHFMAGTHTHQATLWNIGARFPRLHRWAAKHSRLYRLVAVDLANSSPLPPYSPIYYKSPSPQVKSAWAVTGALLERMQQDVAGTGARLLVFYIPRREDVYQAEWQSLQSKLSMPTQDWDLHGVTARFEQLCESEAIRCIDPTSRFVEEGRRERLYNRYDSHWNAAGHRLAAEILEGEILPALDPAR